MCSYFGSSLCILKASPQLIKFEFGENKKQQWPGVLSLCMLWVKTWCYSHQWESQGRGQGMQ